MSLARAPIAAAGAVDLAGRLWLRPGAAAEDALQLQRGNWAARLAAGRRCDELPGLLASLFNLCAQGHRLCARLAVEAAMAAPGGAPVCITAADREALRWETVREHVRRIALDWPLRLGAADGADAIAGSLVALPVLTASQPVGTDWAATRRWLETNWFAGSLSHWLTRWRQYGPAWLAHWSRAGEGWLAVLLRRLAADDVAVVIEAREALTATDALQWTATAALASQGPDGGAHTGCWARAADQLEHRLTPWSLLGARLADLAALALEDGADCGAARLAIGAGRVVIAGVPTGTAWVETSRGLLLHRVQIADAGQVADAYPAGALRVQSCTVWAPTDCNCHAAGPFARAVAATSPAQAGALALLVAAFDPCVPTAIAASEVPHA